MTSKAAVSKSIRTLLVAIKERMTCVALIGSSIRPLTETKNEPTKTNNELKENTVPETTQPEQYSEVEILMRALLDTRGVRAVRDVAEDRLKTPPEVTLTLAIETTIPEIRTLGSISYALTNTLRYPRFHLEGRLKAPDDGAFEQRYTLTVVLDHNAPAEDDDNDPSSL